MHEYLQLNHLSLPLLPIFIPYHTYHMYDDHRDEMIRYENMQMDACTYVYVVINKSINRRLPHHVAAEWIFALLHYDAEEFHEDSYMDTYIT
jgi:hypothetical protein